MTALERLNQRQKELNIVAKKSLGQNFLVSDAVIEKILKATTELNPSEVIEIGPGCGALTDLLIPKYSSFQVIELDRFLAEYWRQQGLTVTEADALQMDWSGFAGKVLVSNLPYQISSSLVIERSLDQIPLKGMVLMFQKEVAQRIRALPQTENYGMLSVMSQEFWSIETVCDAGPRDFRPPPKVASRVLKFIPKGSLVTNRKLYLYFLKTCFQQRRRILKTNLEALSSRFSKELFSEWLLSYKKSDKVRAEELSPSEFFNLYQFLLKGDK